MGIAVNPVASVAISTYTMCGFAHMVVLIYFGILLHFVSAATLVYTLR